MSKHTGTLNTPNEKYYTNNFGKVITCICMTHVILFSGSHLKEDILRRKVMEAHLFCFQGFECLDIENHERHDCKGQ